MNAELKVIHLVCAALFLGNVIVSGVWALMAERTRNHAIIAFSNRMVLITDALFTLVGAVGVVWTGHGMAVHFGGEAGHPWIQWSYALLSFSGLIWLFVLVPIQLKQRALLMASDTVGSEDAARAIVSVVCLTVCALVIRVVELKWIASPISTNNYRTKFCWCREQPHFYKCFRFKATNTDLDDITTFQMDIAINVKWCCFSGLVKTRQCCA
jgi:uncharacterized membrane protein